MSAERWVTNYVTGHDYRHGRNIVGDTKTFPTYEGALEFYESKNNWMSAVVGGRYARENYWTYPKKVETIRTGITDAEADIVKVQAPKW
jgi:hypothetical protein